MAELKTIKMETPQVSFTQVVSRGCGLDVHKKVVVATIDGEGIKKQTREYSTVTSSLKELKDWLLENGITHVAMESTGVFWKPVYNVLEPVGLTVWIVNAAHVKYVPGHKTDKKDSSWLCKLLLAGLLKPSYIPAKEQRELRDLTRYRTKLIQSNASNKNRIIRILEDANIKLSSVLSSTSGVVGTKLIDKICEGKEITMQEIDQVYHKKLEASKEEIYEACQGFITAHHVYMCLSPLNNWNKTINQFDTYLCTIMAKERRQFSVQQIREVRIEDLLGREPIWLNQEKVVRKLKEATVLVTGAAGSIGSEIVRQLMALHTRHVVLVDQAESPLYDLQQELGKAFPDVSFEVVIASVTNHQRMEQVFAKYRPRYVFHAAAYKHVPLMEAAPAEAIRVNVGGTRIIADLSVEYGVKKFVMISTDKAVNPTNVMGASKRICEIYIQALTQSHQVETQFITTRFGNVLGYNGSVVPLFRKQIEAGGPVTVTHRDIIRYFMTIPEACQLVLEAGFMGKGGEIYVFDMGEPVKIYDLAVKMISLSGYKPNEDIPIHITGLRPGEKLYEELLADEENTIPTHHPKIKAARVRQHDIRVVGKAVTEMVTATRIESEMELVCRMKMLVPEFISQNSHFSQLDMPCASAENMQAKPLEN